MCPQSTSAPRYLVPKCTSPTTKAALDPRGAFVFHIPTTNHVYIWAGAQCPDAFVDAAKHFAGQLKKYEGAGLGGEKAHVVRQGSEPQELLMALSGVPSSLSIDDNGNGAVENNNNNNRTSNNIKRTASKQQARSSSPRPAPSTSTTTTTTTTTNGARLIIEENSSYDKEYEMWERAMTSGAGGISGASSARSNGTAGGRKTPRDNLADSATSPNDRLRKYARPELPTIPSLQQQQSKEEGEEGEEEHEEEMSPLRDGHGRKKHSGKGTRGRGRSATYKGEEEEGGLIAAKLSTDTPITSKGRQQQQESGGASLHHHSRRRSSHHHVRGRSDVDVSYIERGVSLDTAAAQLVLAEKSIPYLSGGGGMGLQRVLSDDTAGVIRGEGGVRRVMTRSSSRKKEREGREGGNE